MAQRPAHRTARCAPSNARDHPACLHGRQRPALIADRFWMRCIGRGISANRRSRDVKVFAAVRCRWGPKTWKRDRPSMAAY